MVRKTYFLVWNRAFIACIHSPTRWQETKVQIFELGKITRARSGGLAAIFRTTAQKKFPLPLMPAHLGTVLQFYHRVRVRA